MLESKISVGRASEFFSETTNNDLDDVSICLIFHPSTMRRASYRPKGVSMEGEQVPRSDVEGRAQLMTLLGTLGIKLGVLQAVPRSRLPSSIHVLRARGAPSVRLTVGNARRSMTLAASISHCDLLTGAAVSLTDELRVGIDVEDRIAECKSILNRISSTREINLVKSATINLGGIGANVIPAALWVAKEAAFKALPRRPLFDRTLLRIISARSKASCLQIEVSEDRVGSAHRKAVTYVRVMSEGFLLATALSSLKSQRLH